MSLNFLSLHEIEDKTERNPNAEHDIAFVNETNHFKTGDWNELQHHKRSGENRADNSEYEQGFFAVVIFVHGHARGKAGEQETDRCADCTHIHEPTESLSAENWTGKGDDDTENKRVFRRTVFFVDFAKRLRKITVFAHGIH